MTERFRSQPYDPERHDAREFSCGVESLDSWLRDHAATATARGTARTWVWVDDSDRVVGYYALAAHKVSREHVPTGIGRGGPIEIPAVLLAKRGVWGAGLWTEAEARELDGLDVVRSGDLLILLVPNVEECA